MSKPEQGPLPASVARPPVAVVVLLGAPGAGKGTQAPIVAEHLGVPILGSGDLLRSVAASDSPIAREVSELMRAGELVPDDMIAKIFLDRLDQPDARRGAILDGFPRTRAQAEALDRALADRNQRVDLAVLIHVPVEDLVKRMADRLVCTAAGHVYNLRSNPPRTPGICDVDGSPLRHRADDAEATIRARMAQQLPPLEEVVDHYRAQGTLTTIDGLQSIEAVTPDILATVEPLVADSPAG
jgi:adenylate kinase